MSTAPSTAPLLSVCIPTYNRANRLRVTLEALLPQAAKLGPEVEVWVSDNASTDDTPEVLSNATSMGPVRVSRSSENLGPIANFVHLATALASGHFVWVVGDDDLLLPGSLARVVRTAAAHRELGAIYLSFRTSRYPRHWPQHAVGGVVVPFERQVETFATSGPVERWEMLLAAESSLCTQVYAHLFSKKTFRNCVISK